MDLTLLLALGIFLATILVVVSGAMEGAAAALLGVAVMVWVGVMTEVEAFQYVDWNVMAILLSVWILAGYFGRSGVPEWLAVRALQISGGRAGPLVMILSFLAGILSMFVDNVVVILMLAPVAVPLVRHLGLAMTPVILMIGFSANFMGTALLLGDLPPQMLHSVSGAEFMDFIWLRGRPSSFPILLVTFALTLGAMYLYGFRRSRGAGDASPAAAAARHGGGNPGLAEPKLEPWFTSLALGGFVLTIIGMAFREVLGVKLGFIALSGTLLLVTILQVFKWRFPTQPDLEDILKELDWRAVFFYMALFALVGGIEKVGVLETLAHHLTPLFRENLVLGATLLYWVTVPIVGIVEHDAYILTFLYTIRDLGQQGVEPWPLWWMLVWSGTLGSNLTVAGAPALYVALSICRREEARFISFGEFARWSVPFTLASALVCYILGMLIWVLPYAG